MTTITTYISNWCGTDVRQHPPMVTVEPHEHPRHQPTGIPWSDAYGDGEPRDVLVPDGWTVQRDGLGGLVLCDADGKVAYLDVHDNGVVRATPLYGRSLDLVAV